LHAHRANLIAFLPEVCATMEMWNREELYTEVWEQPLVKAAQKYGISAVMLGKVCRKLQIPLPVRGYWTKKEFGKPVERIPLPRGKDLPVVARFKRPETGIDSQGQQTSPEPEPTDEYYGLIVEMESRTIPSDADIKRHKLATAAEKTLGRGKADNRGIMERSLDQQQCLDIRVTKDSLNRALIIGDSIVKALEAAKFPVTVETGKHSTTALIFGHAVPFAITERMRETGRREVKEYSWTRTLIEYEGTGMLEFRAGDYTSGRKLRDGKRRSLEEMISRCIGLLMREARDRIQQAEQAKLREIEDRGRKLGSGQNLPNRLRKRTGTSKNLRAGLTAGNAPDECGNLPPNLKRYGPTPTMISRLMPLKANALSG